MFRFIGAIIITAAAAVWGIGGALRLRARARILEALTASLNLLKGEVCDRLTPLPELAARLKAEGPPPVRAFYGRLEGGLGELGIKPFSALWRDAVENTPELLLRPREAEALAELGASLGRYNAAEQRGAILYTIRRMETYARQAELEMTRDARTRALLGLGAGVFAVIILL